MSTVRNEVSKKNPYYIPKYRFLELKNFCLQYPTWVQSYKSLDGLSKRPADLAIFGKKHGVSDPTAKCAESKLYFSERISMIDNAAKTTDPVLAEFIVEGVTTGKSYDAIKAVKDIPCCKDIYYEQYRKFFWLLSKARK